MSARSNADAGEPLPNGGADGLRVAGRPRSVRQPPPHAGRRRSHRSDRTKANRGIEAFSIPRSVVARGRNYTWTTPFTVLIEVRVA